MKVIIDFNTDNSAFKEAFDYQVKTIFDKVQKAILADNLSGKLIRDFNGNTIGKFTIDYNKGQ